MSLPPPAPMKRTPMHCGDCCDWHCGLGALAGVPPKMTAYFNAVGQAHATLFELSCGAIMVDAGSQGRRARADTHRLLDRLFSRRIDVIAASIPS